MLNALAAFSAGIELEIAPEKLIAGLGCYSGMRRRFQIRYDNGRGLMIVDDYAHHPSEVKATVSAAKTDGRIRGSLPFFSRTCFQERWSLPMNTDGRFRVPTALLLPKSTLPVKSRKFFRRERKSCC